MGSKPMCHLQPCNGGVLHREQYEHSPQEIPGQTSMNCTRCMQPFNRGGGHGPGFCIDRSPQEMRGIGHEDTSWPTPPKKDASMPPQEIAKCREAVGVDELQLVEPQRIVEAIRDYTITDTWCSKTGDRIMMELQGNGLPRMTLNIDPSAMLTVDGKRAWIVALIDPVS